MPFYHNVKIVRCIIRQTSVNYLLTELLSKTLLKIRLENLKKELHVLIVCPGFTASNIRNTALGSDGNMQGESPRDEQKMMQPEEVAEFILKAVLRRQNSLILTRNGRLTVWLNKFFPKWVDRLVYNHMRKEPVSPF